MNGYRVKQLTTLAETEVGMFVVQNHARRDIYINTYHSAHVPRHTHTHTHTHTYTHTSHTENRKSEIVNNYIISVSEEVDTHLPSGSHTHTQTHRYLEKMK